MSIGKTLRQGSRVLYSLVLLFGMAAVHAAGTCTAGNIAQLRACADNLSSYDGIALSADMVCTGADCCAGNGGALIGINGLSGKVFDGGGHKILRQANQRTCPAVGISQASNVTVRNAVFDEDLNAAPCDPTDNCVSTVDVSGSSNVTLDTVTVSNGKAYVVRGWGVNGFMVRNAAVLNAGIIGIYVGHDDYAPSYKIGIYNSSIIGSRTNGIAIESANGVQDGDNAIVGNVIEGNHWHGLWRDANGAIFPGGQLLIVMANHLLVKDNSIGDGYCDTCGPNTIGGIELGAAEHPNALHHIQVVNNLIYNQTGNAAYVNQGVNLDSSTSFTGNRSVSNGDVISAPHATLSGNAELPTKLPLTWETPDSWPAGWSTWQLCSSGAQVVRWCPGAGEAMGGQCALRLMTASTSCNDGWQGIWTQGAYNPVNPGTTVYLSGWRRNGSYTGKVCLVFQDGTGTETGATCRDYMPVDQWRYQGAPIVQATAPAGTVTFAVKFALNSAYGVADLDNFKVAW